MSSNLHSAALHLIATYAQYEELAAAMLPARREGLALPGAGILGGIEQVSRIKRCFIAVG